MKKLIFAAGLGLAVALSAGAYAQTAVVNVNEIFQKMPEKDAIAKKLEKEFAGRVAELKKMEDDLKTNIQKMQNDGAKMKPEERRKLETSLNAKRDMFTKKVEDFEKDNRDRQMEERNKLLTKIKKAVDEVAKQERYTVVIDMNATAYAAPSIDITAKVMAKVK